MKLEADSVDKIFRDCLFRTDEVIDGKPAAPMTEVQGIIGTRFGFHTERMESHREEVQNLLLELPDNFRNNVGGGWTFLNACNDRHGRHWGEHLNMEQLFCLGIALGIADYQMPREVWSALPGGMPYIYIKMEEFKDSFLQSE